MKRGRLKMQPDPGEALRTWGWWWGGVGWGGGEKGEGCSGFSPLRLYQGERAFGINLGQGGSLTL